jgi:hypothetical protein
MPETSILRMDSQQRKSSPKYTNLSLRPANPPMMQLNASSFSRLNQTSHRVTNYLISFPSRTHSVYLTKPKNALPILPDTIQTPLPPRSRTLPLILKTQSGDNFPPIIHLPHAPPLRSDLSRCPLSALSLPTLSLPSLSEFQKSCFVVGWARADDNRGE